MIKRQKKKISNLGQAIEHFKSNAGITAYKISHLTDINEGTMTKIKYGQSGTQIDTIERIAKVLSVRGSDILLFKEALDDAEEA